MALLARHATSLVQSALADTPVVFIGGPRQAGKSTLVQQLLDDTRPLTYVTLDDPTTAAFANRDPAAFVRQGEEGTLAIDEIQREPALLRTIKAEVDHDRRPGRFLLTGSARVFSLPQVTESLAGRIETVALWPLSQAEWEGVLSPSLIDRLFDGKGPAQVDGGTRAQLFSRLAAGGYPEAMGRLNDVRRRAWFTSYTNALLQRDVRDLASIEGIRQLPDLLRLLSARSGGLLNVASLASDAQLSRTTASRYLTLLEQLYVIQRVAAWTPSLQTRLVKSPKVTVVDSGLALASSGIDGKRLLASPELSGGYVEAFVANELMRTAATSQTQPVVLHFRTHSGQEVDLVLEAPDGRIVAIEVKVTETVRNRDVAGLTHLRDLLGKRFIGGMVLHLADRPKSAGDRLYRAPFDVLWS